MIGINEGSSESAKLIGSENDLNFNTKIQHEYHDDPLLSHDNQKLESYKYIQETWKNKLWNLISAKNYVIFTVLIAIVIVLIVMTIMFDSSNALPSYHGNTDWMVGYDDLGSDSCVRFVDVNQDGAKDIILGTGAYDYPGPNGSPCLRSSETGRCGYILALDGKTGSELWRIFVDGPAFTMNCVAIDINKDGTPDCIANGRYAILTAFDPLTGKVIWSTTSPHINKAWNTLQIAPIPDLDDDGILDFVLANGGEITAKPEEHNRDPGRLLLISSKSGQSIGTFMNMPDGRETYMSPVIYKAIDGTDYVLFGSGGETVNGSFMAMALEDLYYNVTHGVKINKHPIFSGTKSVWKNYHGYDEKTKVYTIFRGWVKGVMTPPIIVDMNLDGVPDMVMLAFDGVVSVYSGVTLSEVWRASFPGYETYSNPAPAYFDDDDYLDFMIHWNYGEYPTYSKVKTVILSGKNGSEIWTLETQGAVMSSELSLHSTQQRRDYYIFSLRGIHVATKDKRRKKRHGYHKNVKCHKPLEPLTTYIYMMDRYSAANPVFLAKYEAEYYTYNFTDIDMALKKLRSHLMGGTPGDTTDSYRGPYCTILSLSEMDACGIADIDGDGSLSLVKIVGKFADLYDSNNDRIKIKDKLYVLKSNIHRKLSGKVVTMKLNVSGPILGLYPQPPNSITWEMLRPYTDQYWTEYTGKNHDNIYRS